MRAAVRGAANLNDFSQTATVRLEHDGTISVVKKRANVPDSAPTPPSAVVLFDGVCNLCDGLVQFIIRHDPAGRFRFAALQSAAGQALLAAHGLPPLAAGHDPSSVLLVSGGRVYSHSAAVLRIARELGWPWRLAVVGGLVPRTWRDALYRYVARHRYRWFGRQESCMLPTPALQQRFLS